mgnify:CR=1 FL=1
MKVKVNNVVCDVAETKISRVDGGLEYLKSLKKGLNNGGTTATLCGGPTLGHWLNVRVMKAS